MKAPAYVVASLAALLFLTACSSDVEDTYETADLKINTALISIPLLSRKS